MTTYEIRTLDFIRERKVTTQVSPTLDEICAHMGWAAKSTAHRVVTELVRQGLLIRKTASKRGLELPDMPKLAAVSTADLRAELARRQGDAL
jgi:SOS-response transcriptional repressor LexA